MFRGFRSTTCVVVIGCPDSYTSVGEVTQCSERKCQILSLAPSTVGTRQQMEQLCRFVIIALIGISLIDNEYGIMYEKYFLKDIHFMVDIPKKYG